MKITHTFNHKGIIATEVVVKLIPATKEDASNEIMFIGDRLFKVILISEKEEIREFGEKYLEHTQVNPDRYEVFIVDENVEFDEAGNPYIENSWKILAQKDQLPPSFLQLIVEGKIKDGDKIILECEHNGTACKFVDHPNCSCRSEKECILPEKLYRLKLSPEGHVIVHLKEEEDIQLPYNFGDKKLTAHQEGRIIGFKEGYRASREEVIKLCKAAFDAGRDYQRGEYSEYHGGHEHNYPDKSKWCDDNIK